MSFFNNNKDDSDETIAGGSSESPMQEAASDAEKPIQKQDANGVAGARCCPYDPPGLIGQILICFKMQIRLFSKELTYIVIALLVVFVPMFMLALGKYVPEMLNPLLSANRYLSVALILLPIMSVLLTSYICGSMLSDEFKERTAYLSLSLPVSRLAFYLGKYLCGLVLSELAMVFVYGSSLAVAVGVVPTFYLEPFLESLAIAMVSVFFTSSFTYMLSAYTSKGAAVLSFFILTLGIPLLLLTPVLMASQIGSSAGFMEGYLEIAGYLPNFLSESAVSVMGPGFSGTYFLFLHDVPFVSFNGLLHLFGNNKDILISMAISIILSILCLFGGYRMTSRRGL
jgi:ABC-type transport system involved in multi-copper enzyme maturation permease subunit